MKQARAADHGALQSGLTLGQAFRTPAFLRIAVAAFVSMMMGVAVVVHQVPILTATGVTRQNAALLASITGIAALFGKLTTGWLMDRADAGVVGAVTLALSALGFPMLLDQFRSVPLIILAMFLIGYAGGTKLQVCAYLTGRYVGLRNYGRIFGTMSSIIALGSGIGPFMASAIFDKTGSYTIFLIVGGLGTLAISPLILRLGPYPDWSSDQAAR